MISSLLRCGFVALFVFPAAAQEFGFGEGCRVGEVVLEPAAIHTVDMSCQFQGAASQMQDGISEVAVQCATDFPHSPSTLWWYVTNDGKLIYSFGQGLNLAYPCR